MKRVRGALPYVLCALTFAPGLEAGQAAGSTDQQLKTRVEQRLSQRRVRGIRVAAHDGSVTLVGPIGSVGAKQDLVAEILKVDGVREIVSELTIGRAENDRALAERVAEQVRRSSYFTVFDDVEIGVDNGVVTLTGYVTQPIKSDDLARRVSTFSTRSPLEMAYVCAPKKPCTASPGLKAGLLDFSTMPAA